MFNFFSPASWPFSHSALALVWSHYHHTQKNNVEQKKCVCGWTNRILITVQEFPIHFFCFKSFLQTSCCLCELFCMQCTRTLFVYSGRSMSIYIHVIINFVNNKQWQQHCMSFYMLYSLIKNSFEFFVVTVVITLRWTWSKDQLVYRLRNSSFKLTYF